MSELDWIFSNGRVFCGDGEGFKDIEVGVRGDSIEVVGDLTGAEGVERIDLNGRVLSPGFIDLHSHSDLSLIEDGRGISKITQGVTTEVTGNCSMSPAPVNSEIKNDVKDNCSYMAGEVHWTWDSFGEYLNVLRDSEPGLNVVPQVGHGTLRTYVVGFEDRPATSGEISDMKACLREILRAGGRGFSTGLMYPPSSYADQEEIIELCNVVAKEGGLYSTHMRNEGWTMLESLEETLEVTRRTGVRTQISHLKAGGPPNWGDVRGAVDLIELAREDGFDVSFDVYPYTRGSTQLRSLLPPFVTRGGRGDLLERLNNLELRPKIKHAMENGTEDWDGFFGPGALTPERIQIAAIESRTNRELQGMTLDEIAVEWNQDPWDALCDLLLEEEGLGLCLLDLLNEADVSYLLSVPFSTIASDGLAIPDGGHWAQKQPHPRYFGCFPRVLSKYVRAESVLSLAGALRKMTILPARRINETERGRIDAGTVADLVVFDPKRISDEATFGDPLKRSSGVDWLFINGSPVIKHGEVKQTRPGSVL